MDTLESKIKANLDRVFHSNTYVETIKGRSVWVNKLVVQKRGGCPPIEVGLMTSTDGGIITIGKDRWIKVPLSVVLDQLIFWERTDWATPMLALYERCRGGSVDNPTGLYGKMVQDVVDGHRPKNYKPVRWELKPPP